MERLGSLFFLFLYILFNVKDSAPSHFNLV